MRMRRNIARASRLRSYPVVLSTQRACAEACVFLRDAAVSLHMGNGIHTLHVIAKHAALHCTKISDTYNSYRLYIYIEKSLGIKLAIKNIEPCILQCTPCIITRYNHVFITLEVILKQSHLHCVIVVWTSSSEHRP